MKNNKGVTLTSLVIYIVLITVVMAIVMRITTHFSNNMENMADVSFETEFNKLNLYLLDESKKTNNRIQEIKDGTQITFSNGNKYFYNAENKTIYLNGNIKVCENVETCLFEKKTSENGKEVISLTITINETTKTTDYVMGKSGQEENNINIDEYLWGESLLNYYLKIGHYVDYVPDVNSYTVEKGDYGSGIEEDQTFSTQQALKWRVLSINQDNVELISDTPSTEKLRMKGAARI